MRSSTTREPLVFIRLGALGDTLLALPALSLARRHCPEAHITLVGRPDTLALLRALGIVDRALSYDLPDWAAIFAADAMATDMAREILAGAGVVAWLRDTDGLVARTIEQLGAARVVVASPQPPAGGTMHAALLAVQAVRALGIAITPPATLAELLAAVPPLTPAPEDEAEALARWSALGVREDVRVVALHAGSGGAAKRWPPQSFAQLAERLMEEGLQPMLIEGPQDAEVVAAVAAVAAVRHERARRGEHEPPLVVRGLSVGALAAVLRRCAAYAGNDSGVTHLAALLGLPGAALFGPSDPVLWAPLNPAMHVIQAASGDMADIEVEWVVSAVRAALAREAFGA